MSTVLEKKTLKVNNRGKEEDMIVPKTVKVVQTGRAAPENPFEKEEWCRRTVAVKVANGNTYSKAGQKFGETFMEGLEKESSSDTDDEQRVYNRKLKTTDSNNFQFSADLKKRPKPSGLQAAPGMKLPDNVEVILEDMDTDMQLMVIEAVNEAIEAFPDSDEDGAQRAKKIKQLLDERLEHSWHCCVISDQFWAGCSFQPGYTFAFEMGDYTYLVWRTPSAKNRFN